MATRFVLIAALAIAMSGGAEADQFEDGLAAANHGDYGGAFKLWQPLAVSGMPNAQNNLGSLYSLGLGVKQDQIQADKWYQAAADQGLAEAQNNLGYAYEKGLGVGKDYAQAATWYQRAAEQGNALGELNIGLFYANGISVPMDPVQAFMWLGLASAQGQDVARTVLRTLLTSMSTDQVNEGLTREHAFRPTVVAK